MQCLYEWDFQKKKDIKEIIERNLKAFEKEELDKKYINKVVKGVTGKANELDKKIQDAATEWPLDQLPILDKTILRLAGYELLFMEGIPPKVAINEAVELSKTFGGENTSKFVNGVLGTLYRQSEKYIPEEGDLKKQWADLKEKIRKSQQR
jgi:N utilization substance protein B